MLAVGVSSKEQEVQGLPPPYQQPAQYPAASPAIQYSVQYQPATTVVQQVPYQGGPTAVVVPAGTHRNVLPREMQPNDYLVLTLIVTIACGIFNLTSLFFTVPALICSVLAYERRNNAEYKTAQKLGMTALILAMLGVAWVVIGGVLTVGILAGCIYGRLCGLNY